MLTKYELIHVPSGGVDHLLDGNRIRIDTNLTNEQADRLRANGLPYFREIKQSSLPNESDGKPQNSAQNSASRNAGWNNARNAKGQFTSKSAS